METGYRQMMFVAVGCLGLPTLDALEAVGEENKERNKVDFVSEDESAKVSWAHKTMTYSALWAHTPFDAQARPATCHINPGALFYNKGEQKGNCDLRSPHSSRLRQLPGPSSTRSSPSCRLKKNK